MNRRSFLNTTSALTALSALPAVARASTPVPAPAAGGRKMRVALVPGSIGVNVKSQRELNALAARHRFEAVEPRAEELATLSADQLAEVLADLKTRNLAWAAAGLSVDFRKDERALRDGLAQLPRLAAALQRAGATRIGTWVSPSHDQLTYRANFDQHATRLREVARILKDHGLRLGLEYVGTQLNLVGKRYPFLHTMAETRELIAAIGTGNVGLVLDTWHWWTAGDTEADLLALTPADVVTVDLNDAPAGLAKPQQKDNERELPVATGVIPTAVFLSALHKIGYDGPVRCEPFNKTLNALDNDPACAAVSAAMHQAMTLIRA
jgi:sugar phosphate isomerase/epimerase